jgi:type VI secretion system protein ImpG
MDPRQLEYYTHELLYLRELAGEFARQHPKITRRLGMQAGEIGDPYVGRLIQSASMTFARMQMRIDEEFPRLMQPLLEAVYPNYVSPTPAMAVARVFPGHGSGHAGKGFLIPRGTAFRARTPVGENTACEFRSSQDVTLYPLEIVQARLTGIPPDIPSLDRYVRDGLPVHGALRLRLRTTNGTAIASLVGLDRLPVYLTGDERTASHLFEQILSAGVASVMAEPDRFAHGRLHAVTRDAVVHEGLDPGQNVLPAVPRKFHGHNLVHEYFACPARFWFFALMGLQKGLAAIVGHEVEIVILLRRSPGALADTVDASHFALFCTPVINLFPLPTRRMKIQPEQSEHRLVVKPDAPLDYEVHSVQLARGQISEDSGDLQFRPAHTALRYDEDDEGRFFTVRRELYCNDAGRHGTHRTFTETRTWVSLVDCNGQPNESGCHYLSVDALVTNRDLPAMLQPNGRDDLIAELSAPIAGIGFVRAPGQPRPPLAHGIRAWQLYGQLNLDYTMFDDRYHEPPPGEGVRRLLRLFLDPEMGVFARQVESLTAAVAEPVNDFMPGQSGIYGRGIECRLSFDETGFEGMSPYTFALVLEHYVARHVGAHSFTRTRLHTNQRGMVMSWRPRPGTREVF